MPIIYPESSRVNIKANEFYPLPALPIGKKPALFGAGFPDIGDGSEKFIQGQRCSARVIRDRVFRFTAEGQADEKDILDFPDEAGVSCQILAV